jgi:hypothetical protein
MALKYLNIFLGYFFVTTMIVIATNIKSTTGEYSYHAFIKKSSKIQEFLITENIEKPYFDDVNARNVSTNIDGIAILKCRVKNKGNRTVSIYIFVILEQ